MYVNLESRGYLGADNVWPALPVRNLALSWTYRQCCCCHSRCLKIPSWARLCMWSKSKHPILLYLFIKLLFDCMLESSSHEMPITVQKNVLITKANTGYSTDCFRGQEIWLAYVVLVKWGTTLQNDIGILVCSIINNFYPLPEMSIANRNSSEPCAVVKHCGRIWLLKTPTNGTWFILLCLTTPTPQPKISKVCSQL